MENKDISKVDEGLVNQPKVEPSISQLKEEMDAVRAEILILKEVNKKVITLLVHSDPKLIALLDEPDIELQKSIVKFFPGNFAYIKNPSGEFKKQFVNENPDNIRYVKDPDEEIQLLAVQKSRRTLTYLKDPSRVVMATAIKDLSDNVFGKFINELRNDGRDYLAATLLAIRSELKTQNV